MFYFFSILSILATFRVITHQHPVYSLLYLITSILSIACAFFSLGSYFAGVLEVIIYAGAVMVLFVFVIMLLNSNDIQFKYKSNYLYFIIICGSILFSILFLILLLFSIWNIQDDNFVADIIDIQHVGKLLFGPYLLVVEIASLLLLGGLIVVIYYGINKK